MTERNQFAGAFGGHDSSEPGDGKDVALGGAAVTDEGECGRIHAHQSGCFGFTLSFGFGAGVHHASGTRFIEMGKFTHRVWLRGYLDLG